MVKNKKITTIEDLVIMVQKGFEEILETTAKKKDVKEGFETINRELLSLKSEVLTIRHDLDELKLKINKMDFSFEIQDIEKRLKRVEAELQLK